MLLGKSQLTPIDITIKTVVIKKYEIEIGGKIVIKIANTHGLILPLNAHAECGKLKKGPRPYKPWQVFLITKTKRLLCVGTIVTSNLLLITHECLERDHKKFALYDGFSPFGKSQNLYHPDDYRIVKDPDIRISYFKIVKIIFNFRHSIKVTTLPHEYNENLVLLKVTPPFTSDPDLAPACIPLFGESTRDLRNHEVYYYGVWTEDENPETFKYLEKCVKNHWNKTLTTAPPKIITTDVSNPASRNMNMTSTASSWMQYLKLRYNSSEPAQYLGSIYGQVIENQAAEEQGLLTINRKENKVPKWDSGALFYRSIDVVNEDHRTFIVGTVASANASSKELINFYNMTSKGGTILYI